VSAPPVLALEAATRRFDDLVAVDALDLVLRAGERTALLGPNGSGKSTVLRMVAGTLTPSSGDVRVLGHPAGSLPARQSIGASLSQERSFYLRLTGRQNLRFFARMRGFGRRAAATRVAALEEELELADIAGKRVDRCSTGMVQQLAVARALLGDPALVLLDEPTRSLDAGARERMWGALERRPQLGALIATHLPDDVEHCGASVVLG
jgi:ABC-type multidrug transport system ATPase subunit